MTSLYVLTSLVAVAHGKPYTEFEGQEAGLAAILENITGSTWPGTLLAAGAVISIFSVTLVVIYGQTRILFTMARDGMLPELFHRVNPRTARHLCRIRSSWPPPSPCSQDSSRSTSWPR